MVDITLVNGCFDIVVDVVVVFERLMGSKIYLRVPNSLQRYHVREDEYLMTRNNNIGKFIMATGHKIEIKKTLSGIKIFKTKRYLLSLP